MEYVTGEPGTGMLSQAPTLTSRKYAQRVEPGRHFHGIQGHRQGRQSLFRIDQSSILCVLQNLTSAEP